MTRCGFCAILGAPNAGKSTLANALAGQKVSIVTHKVQTTRSRLRAIAMAGDTQIVFVDTPGIFAPKRKLDTAMVSAAWAAAGEADARLLMVDVRGGLDGEAQKIIEGLKDTKLPAMLALNKIDLIPRDTLLGLAQQFNDAFAFSDTFMISALKGHGVEEVKTKIAAQMPEGPWLYPADQPADVQVRFLASEITREKLFLRLHQELPYASTVETESWEERKDGSIRIGQVIYVARESQKKIVLGAKGETIRDIGAAARKELEIELDTKVHLFLFVKVRENWAEDPERLRMMGLG